MTEYSSMTYEEVVKYAKGSYQRGILSGAQCLSGADLRGAARGFGGAYARSRGNLFARLRAAGYTVSERRGPHNKRVLIISRE